MALRSLTTQRRCSQWHANEEVAWLAFESGDYLTNEGVRCAPSICVHACR